MFGRVIRAFKTAKFACNGRAHGGEGAPARVARYRSDERLAISYEELIDNAQDRVKRASP